MLDSITGIGAAIGNGPCRTPDFGESNIKTRIIKASKIKSRTSQIHAYNCSNYPEKKLRVHQNNAKGKLTSLKEAGGEVCLRKC